MSPRVVPKHERNADAELVNRWVQADALQRMGRCTSAAPYTETCGHSYFRDLLLVAESDARSRKALESPVLRGRDQGAADFSDVRHGLKEARDRLRTTLIKDRSEARDLSVSSANEGLRPSLPGYLQTVWGRASRNVGTLADAFGIQELLPGMIDTSSNLPVVTVPRITAGAGVAVQASENVGIQETDPQTAAATSPVSSIAGMVDLSRQLLEFSKPGLDVAIADDLARAHAQALDVEIVSGTASGGRTRGLLSTAGILSVAATVTNASTFLASLWQAYSAAAYGSGYGVSNTEGYVTVLHPRRAAWLYAGVSGTLPPGTSLVPGQLVISAGIPTTLGAGTNEDVGFVIARDQVLLLSDGPRIQLFEQVGSGTLTVRVRAVREAAVVVLNPAAVCKVTGLVAPAGF
jgi:hypothetical protein